ncbi:hypothetical protein AAVH_27376 [Aphelenchoides avenae]|nr:hypothetical protein AAVH_27376 [Aphelenchus avenae]
MQRVLVYESLKFHPRDGLERLQMFSRMLRNMVWDDAFPPSSFILQEPGYPNNDLRCADGSNVADAIDDLIESFVRDGCSNRKLESVFVLWYDDESPAPKRLRKPTKVDRPLPEAETIFYWLPDRHLVPECETHSFVNTKQWKRMEVY